MYDLASSNFLQVYFNFDAAILSDGYAPGSAGVGYPELPTRDGVNPYIADAQSYPTHTPHNIYTDYQGHTSQGLYPPAVSGQQGFGSQSYFTPTYTYEQSSGGRGPRRKSSGALGKR